MTEPPKVTDKQANDAADNADAPVNPQADDWKQWEDEDTGRAGQARSKGALIALAVVLVLLGVAVLVSTLRDDDALPAAWDKPDGVEVLDKQIGSADGTTYEYYRLEWSGDPQAVLTETLDMVGGVPAGASLADGETAAAIDEAIVNHRRAEQPGKNIAMPDGVTKGVYCSYVPRTDSASQLPEAGESHRDIYVWRQDGVCLVEIFSY